MGEALVVKGEDEDTVCAGTSCACPWAVLQELCKDVTQLVGSPASRAPILSHCDMTQKLL